MLMSFTLMLVSIGTGAAIRGVALSGRGPRVVVLDGTTVLIGYALTVAMLLAAFFALAKELRQHRDVLASCGRGARAVRGLAIAGLAAAGATAVFVWTSPAFGQVDLPSTLLVALALGGYVFSLVLLLTGLFIGLGASRVDGQRLVR